MKTISSGEIKLINDHLEMARVLHKRLLGSCKNLNDNQLSKIEGLDKDVLMMAKEFLIISMQLSGQIIESLSMNCNRKCDK